MKSLWARLAAAPPPDVSSEDILQRYSGAYGCGSAAGCEAGLRPAVASVKKRWGYAPGPASGPETLGQSPNQGRSPPLNSNIDGGAEPRLTSGGEAAA